MKNKVQLITYTDRLSNGNIKDLSEILANKFNNIFSGVHILPFYYPIDGSDAGFDPIDHTNVDKRLGDWDNIKDLSQNVEIMADLIVNHVSAESSEFKDVLAKGEASQFWDMFLKETDIFPQGITPEQAEKIYRPRPGSCFTEKQLASGKLINFWTTFTDNQLDINVESEEGAQYLEKILTLFSESGVKIIRLDAAGYAIKRANTSCFMTDEAFAFINKLSKRANELGMETIAEIHSHFETQVEVAKKVNRVYDFALPPLILHTIFTHNVDSLVKWLKISPRNCLTVLDTHDGIGIIDVGAEGDKSGLLNEDEIDQLVEKIHENTHRQSLEATGNAASNVDLYQVNCTYYDALGRDDIYYIISRAIQFFSPGVPQVYYGGFLAMTNDMALLNKTNVGRDINRPYIAEKELQEHLTKPVVKSLIKLIEIRNNTKAFDGKFVIKGEGHNLEMTWNQNTSTAQLQLDLEKGVAKVLIKEDLHVMEYDLTKGL